MGMRSEPLAKASATACVSNRCGKPEKVWEGRVLIVVFSFFKKGKGERKKTSAERFGERIRANGGG